MKKQLTLLAACALVGAAAANATCWRINPSPFAKAQFQTVAEAMADINVLPGDTLLLDPGQYNGIDLKRDNMTIIGTGYLLDMNTKWSETQVSIATSVYLTAGSKIEGVRCTGSIIASAKNCVISRCYSNSIKSQNTGVESTLVEGCLANSISVESNGIARNNIIISDSYNACLKANNGIIENNTVIRPNSTGYGSAEYAAISANNSTIRNNIIINTQAGFDSNNVPYSAKNCIDFSPSQNNVIINNILSIPARYADTNYTNNYFVGATMENTFVNTGSTDSKYVLLDSSAAKGAATHGGDCGAFGGATPYVLSGIPMFLPHITEALVPAKPTDGKITVKLKIENQNE